MVLLVLGPVDLGSTRGAGPGGDRISVDAGPVPMYGLGPAPRTGGERISVLGVDLAGAAGARLRRRQKHPCLTGSSRHIMMSRTQNGWGLRRSV
jgi:hypothetical protein